MQDESAILELAASDMAELTVNDIVCVDCIEGFCPARTPSAYNGTEFVLCGAKAASQPVLARYQNRTGIELHIERPC